MDKIRTCRILGPMLNGVFLVLASSLLCLSSSCSSKSREIKEIGTKASGNTDMVPWLADDLSSDTNTLWCASFRLAWEELRKRNDGQTLLGAEPGIQRVKANEKRPRWEALSGVRGIQSCGVTRKQWLQRPEAHESEISQHPFDKQLKNAVATSIPESVVCYASIRSSVKFAQGFKRFDDQLTFSGTPVISFGIVKDKGRIGADCPDVACYGEDDGDGLSVVIRNPQSESMVVLSKVEPQSTLRATLDQAMSHLETESPQSLKWRDRLQIPVVSVGVFKRYKRIEGEEIKAGKMEGWPITFAGQMVDFRLDESGAHLDSKAGLVAESDRPPSDVAFDKPFLLALVEAKTSTPYFVMWVATPDVLQPVKSW